jgi:spermidine synthase
MNDERQVIEQISNRGGEIALQRVSGPDIHYELLYNQTVFRSTYDKAVSQAFAETILGLIKSARGVDVLLGGLGLGSTLQSVLDHPGLRSVTVVDPDEALPGWCRKHLDMAPALDDERTQLVVGSFPQFVEAAPTSYHGIGLEIDLGPTRVLQEENRRAYSMSTLSTLASRLRTEGVLVVRVSEEDKAYQRALDEVFSEVGAKTVERTNSMGQSVTGVFYVARM